MRFVLALLPLLPLTRAVLPLACMCTVNEKVLTYDYSPFVGCGAHRYDSRWCNVMDPENCKNNGFDCDVCDDPDDCVHHYHKERCEVNGGVHLWDRYAKEFHPGVFWKFCSGDRCVPLLSPPYKASALDQISLSFTDSFSVEDWPDCCALCRKYDGCVAWKWVYPATMPLEAAPARCNIFKFKLGVSAGSVKNSLKRFEEGQNAYTYARSGQEMTVWGVRGFDDAPTSCLTRGGGLCHEDLYVFVSFCILFVLISMFTACCCLAKKAKFRSFVSSGWVIQGFAEGVSTWEETYTWTDKNGTHTGRRQRYRSKIEFECQRHVSVVFTDKDSKSVCGGVCYDKSTAKNIYKKGRHAIKVLCDPKDPQQFVTEGPWMWEIGVHLIGIAFLLASCLMALRTETYAARNQGAVDWGRRDAALEIPGWGSWEKAYAAGFEGSEWASFYDVEKEHALATAFLVIGLIFFSALLVVDGVILSGCMTLRNKLAFGATKKVAGAVVGRQVLR